MSSPLSPPSTAIPVSAMLPHERIGRPRSRTLHPVSVGQARSELAEHGIELLLLFPAHKKGCVPHQVGLSGACLATRGHFDARSLEPVHEGEELGIFLL